MILKEIVRIKKGYPKINFSDYMGLSDEAEFYIELNNNIRKVSFSEKIMSSEEIENFKLIISDFKKTMKSSRKENIIIKQDVLKALEEFNSSIKNGSFFKKMNSDLNKLLTEVVHQNNSVRYGDLYPSNSFKDIKKRLKRISKKDVSDAFILYPLQKTHSIISFIDDSSCINFLNRENEILIHELRKKMVSIEENIEKNNAEHIYRKLDKIKSRL